MILSRFCKIYPYPDDLGSVILFSTKSAAKIAIPRSVLEDIGRDNLFQEEKESLHELGFLAKSEDEEKAELLGFMDGLNAADKVFAVQLVMNLDCNLACGYCFEGSRKGKFYLTRQTTDKFVEFVKKNIQPDIEKISIKFYGGEPLLSRDLILAVSDSIQSFANERGIAYAGKLATNATLLTLKSVTQLRTAGIKAASITLDGPESVHDTSRPFKNGQGSFKTIMKNLKDVCDMLALDIGGNYTKNNYLRFPELLDRLIAEGLTPARVSSMQFYPVIQEAEGTVNHDFKEGCGSVNEPWIFGAELFLREEVLKRGYKTSRMIPSACFMELKNRIIVNYDGALYKCSGLIGREEYKVGDIKTGIKDFRISHNLDNWKNDECLNCAYLPLCFGGCRYMKFLRDGSMDGVDCKKPYLDAILETLVKQDIKYGLTKS